LRWGKKAPEKVLQREMGGKRREPDGRKRTLKIEVEKRIKTKKRGGSTISAVVDLERGISQKEKNFARKR